MWREEDCLFGNSAEIALPQCRNVFRSRTGRGDHLVRRKVFSEPVCSRFPLSPMHGLHWITMRTGAPADQVIMSAYYEGHTYVYYIKQM